MKIEIDIKDKRKYAIVATFIDRKDVLKDIILARESLNLTKFPYSLPKYLYDEANRISEFYTKNFITIYWASEMLKEFCREQNIKNISNLDRILSKTEILTEIIVKKYKKNNLYNPVIFASILTGRINDDDFLSTQMYWIDKESLFDEIKQIGDNKIMTIRITSESTKQEILNVFSHIQSYYFKNKPTSLDDNLANVYGTNRGGKLPIHLDNIVRDRDWYWQKQNGSSYAQIKQKAKEDYNDRSILRGIELAIKRYSDRLVIKK